MVSDQKARAGGRLPGGIEQGDRIEQFLRDIRERPAVPDGCALQIIDAVFADGVWRHPPSLHEAACACPNGGDQRPRVLFCFGEKSLARFNCQR